MDNFVLDPCKTHEDCTIKATFLSSDDPRFDPITDQKPVSEWIQTCATDAFGDCWCYEVEHMAGKLAIEVPV